MQRTHNKMSFMVDVLEHAAHYMHVPDLTHMHVEQLTRAREVPRQSSVTVWQPSLEC